MSLTATPQEYVSTEKLIAIAIEEADVQGPQHVTLAAVAEVRIE